MAVGVVAGDAIAGEANAGHPALSAGRPGRAAPGCCSPSTPPCWRSAWPPPWWWRVSALATGALLFPLGDVTTDLRHPIRFADGLLRALLIALVVAASLVGVAALGLFVSTLTNSGIAAMATTVGLLITVQILDQIPQLHAIQPYLFPHYWLSFADLLRDPVYWDGCVKNLGLQALYAAVFGSAAWARFTAKDITPEVRTSRRRLLHLRRLRVCRHLRVRTLERRVAGRLLSGAERPDGVGDGVAVAVQRGVVDVGRGVAGRVVAAVEGLARRAAPLLPPGPRSWCSRRR